jgi:hypothetical protein
MITRFELDPEAEGALDKIKRKTGIKDEGELFNNALTILAWAIEQRERGRQVASMDREKRTYRELQMPIFDRIAEH